LAEKAAPHAMQKSFSKTVPERATEFPAEVVALGSSALAGSPAESRIEEFKKKSSTLA